MTVTLPAGMQTAYVTWDLLGVAEDFPAQDVQITEPRGFVRFEPTAVAVNLDDATILPAPVETRVAGGVMRTVRLMVNNPDLWNWRVTPRLGVAWEPFHVDVTPDGVDLANAAVVPGKGPIRAVTGPRGFSVVEAEETDGEVQFVLENGARTSAVPLPVGPVGPANQLSIGSVSEGEPSATLTGDAPSQTLSLTLPRGEQGLPGVNAVPADEAVAGYVTSTSQTNAVLEARYRRSVSVMEYGATGDGTTDDTAAVQAALTDNPGANIYFPPGTYRLTDHLAVPSGTAVSGADSASTLLDWSTKTEFTTPALLRWEPGTLDAPIALTVGAQFADTTLTVGEGHGLVAGDIIRITADDTLWNTAVKAEFQRILEADATTLTLSGPVFDTYQTVHAARIQKAHMATAALHGVSIRGKGINPGAYGDNAVNFVFARDVHVTDVKFADVEHRCLILESVLGADIDSVHFRFDTSRTPLQYGVAIGGASQNIMVRGCSAWNDRHMVTTNHSAVLAESRTEGRGIPRLITVTGCTAHGSWQSPIDTHQGGEYIAVVGNALNSESAGVKVRSPHALISGNVIVGKRTSVGGVPTGVRVAVTGENIRITGNLIRGFEQGVRIDTLGNTTRELAVSDNNIVDCVRPVNLAGDYPLDGVRVSGNVLSATDDGYPVYLGTNITDLDITANTLLGGVNAVYCAPALTTTRAVIQSNTFRGQSSYGMFLRNITDALVTGNFSPGGEIRFAEECVRVTTSLNRATITDITTHGIDVQDLDTAFSPTWVPVTIRPGYAQASTGYPLGYSITGRTVRLRGRVARADGDLFPAEARYAVSVPAPGRPVAAVSQAAGADGAGAVVDIATNGILNVIPDSPTAWVSLDGITYDLD